MPKVALLSRVKAKEGKGEELIAAFQPVFELAGKSPARCSMSCTGPGTILTCSGPPSFIRMTKRLPPTVRVMRWPRPRRRWPR